MRHRPRALLTLANLEEQALRDWLSAHPTGTPQALRAHILLASARASSVSEVARQLGCTRITVQRWLDRWQRLGPSGLHDYARPGRPRKLSPSDLQALLKEQEVGLSGRKLCPRAFADATGVSPSTVRRALRRVVGSSVGGPDVLREPPAEALVGLHISGVDLVFAAQLVPGRGGAGADEVEPRAYAYGELLGRLHRISSQIRGGAARRSPHRVRLLHSLLAALLARAEAGARLQVVHVGPALPVAHFAPQGLPPTLKILTLQRTSAWWRRLESLLQQCTARCCTIEGLVALERIASRGLESFSRGNRTLQWMYSEPPSLQTGEQGPSAPSVTSGTHVQSRSSSAAAGCELRNR